MYIFKITILIAASFLTVVSSTCFGTGQTWGSSLNRQKASAALGGVCDQIQGSYSTSQIKSLCRNGNDGIRFNFRIENISGRTRNLPKGECIDGLNKEITGCDRGGVSSYTNWKYTSDPNTGGC